MIKARLATPGSGMSYQPLEEQCKTTSSSKILSNTNLGVTSDDLQAIIKRVFLCHQENPDSLELWLGSGAQFSILRDLLIVSGTPYCFIHQMEMALEECAVNIERLGEVRK